MSSMDKLIPQNPTPITNTTTTTTTHWDLPIASMDADHHHHHHQILHDHHTNHLFPFASLPTWSNYSPLLLPPPPPIIHHISSSSPPTPPPPPSSSSLVAPRITKQMETLAGREEEIAEEEDGDADEDGDGDDELGAMKEMMYNIAAMQPVEIDPATIRRPKRRNVRISDDPQSVAARLRRERISEKIRILQRLVPGGTKLDTASMLDEAVRYVKFLKRQIRRLQRPDPATTASTSVASAGDIQGELPLCFGYNEG